MGRNILVVEAVEHAEAALRARLGDDVDEVRVVVPVVRQGFFDWLANDERAASDAEEEASRLADELPQVVDARKGEADVMLAIRDGLQRSTRTRSSSPCTLTRRRCSPSAWPLPTFGRASTAFPCARSSSTTQPSSPSSNSRDAYCAPA